MSTSINCGENTEVKAPKISILGTPIKDFDSKKLIKSNGNILSSNNKHVKGIELLKKCGWKFNNRIDEMNNLLKLKISLTKIEEHQSFNTTTNYKKKCLQFPSSKRNETSIGLSNFRLINENTNTKEDVDAIQVPNEFDDTMKFNDDKIEINKFYKDKYRGIDLTAGSFLCRGVDKVKKEENQIQVDDTLDVQIGSLLCRIETLEDTNDMENTPWLLQLNNLSNDYVNVRTIKEEEKEQPLNFDSRGIEGDVELNLPQNVFGDKLFFENLEKEKRHRKKKLKPCEKKPFSSVPYYTKELEEYKNLVKKMWRRKQKMIKKGKWTKLDESQYKEIRNKKKRMFEKAQRQFQAKMRRIKREKITN